MPAPTCSRLKSFRPAVRLFAAAVMAAAVAGPAPVAAQAGGVSVPVRVENPLDLARPDEVVALAWAELENHLPGLAADGVRVRDAASLAEVTSQVYDADVDGVPDELLFLAALWPNEVRTYLVEAAAPETPAVARAHVAYIAERDDVAWESDRIAFRIYGQGLWQAEGYDPLVSSGIDIWPKRVRALVIDRWYALGHDAYHQDRGEGADFFSVGPTLGGGGTAVWAGGTLHRAANFKTHRIVADGPLRAAFEVTYEPWDAGGRQVSQVKRVTIDAGRHLFREESVFHSPDPAPLDYAVGFVKRQEGVVGSTRRAGAFTWLATWGPVERKAGGHGMLGTGALVAGATVVDVRETDDHYLLIARTRPGEPVTHYIGAGWTASGAFDGVEAWWAHLDDTARRLAAPVVVTLAPTRP